MFIVLKKLLWFFKEHRKRYLIALTLLMLLNFVEIVPAQLVGHSIDSMNQGTMNATSLLQIVGIYIAVVIVMYVFGFVWQYNLFGGGILLQRTMRSRLVRHLLRMTPTFFEKNRTGDLMARATNDLNAVAETAGFGILTLVDSTTFAGTILITMGFSISWKLTLLAIVPVPFIGIALTRYGKVIHKRFTLAQDAFGDMNDRVLETIAGIRVVRAYVQEHAEENRFAQTTKDVYEKNVAVARVDALFEPTIKILVGFSYLTGLGYGAYMVFRSEITLGELTSFNVYLGMLIWPMIAIGELINVMQRGNASLDRVTETLSYHPDVVDGSEAIENVKPESVEFNNYSFRYPLSNTDNLSEIDLRIERGQTIGIVGRTGSGKSTLLKQILRDYPLGQGEIRVNGLPIEHIALSKLHSWLGYVPQESLLFSRTVEENVRFAAPSASVDEVAQALEMACFTKDISLLPNGLQTLVGEKGVALSGGQKQRIALARAFVTDPEMLILDDAMSAVDARTEVHIVEAIREHRRGRTTLIATHRLSAVEHADWIIVLDDGRIVEQGVHEDLIRLGRWYAEQYARQNAQRNVAEEEGEEHRLTSTVAVTLEER